MSLMEGRTSQVKFIKQTAVDVSSDVLMYFYNVRCVTSSSQFVDNMSNRSMYVRLYNVSCSDFGCSELC